jgi:hypothetical protein
VPERGCLSNICVSMERSRRILKIDLRAYLENLIRRRRRTHLFFAPSETLNFDNLQFDPVEHFRFTVPQMRMMIEVLELPRSIRTANRHTASSLEGFAIMCKRLACPNRWVDLEHIFHRSAGTLADNQLNDSLCSCEMVPVVAFG